MPLGKQDKLAQALEQESRKFEQYYLWLERAMPRSFFEDVTEENRLLIVHNLMGFNLQEYFTTIQLKGAALVMCLESADADLRILKNYALYGIKNYQSYVSSCPPPFAGVSHNLRISQIYFTEATESGEEPLPYETQEQLRALVKQRNPEVSDAQFDHLIRNIHIRFFRSLPIERVILALDMFFRARTRDNCQYEVRYNEDWKEKDSASMQIVLAWRSTPKHHFLYRMARLIHRYGLVMKRVNAVYVDPLSPHSILVMAISLHGGSGEAVWDVADIPDFLRELATMKYFPSFDLIDEELVKPKYIKGKMGNFLRCCIDFIHQSLVAIDPHLYTPERIEEDLCRHPELTSQICAAFEWKFDPDVCDFQKYLQIREQFLKDILHLDTGHPHNDSRRRSVLKQAMHLVDYCLKTNYFRLNYTSISFRLDPKYLDEIPFNRLEKFPELPYAIFYIKGMHFFGFHIRFKDLSRGGVRTVFPKQIEQMVSERNTVFAECYYLAYTQHKKNKDIPEGGAKGIIFLKPFERLHSETLILKREFEDSKLNPEEIKHKLAVFKNEQEIEYLYQSQRSFVASLLTIVNCHPDGKIKARNVIDYWKRPEYLYLGPDEYLHDQMIEWIAQFSKRYEYKPGGAFISGKPQVGINHKEFGVTSLGIAVYLDYFLKYLGIHPSKDPFTLKMSGGPDGDVAGNLIRTLHQHYPQTAKIVALTDISGTIYDPEGVDLNTLVELFYQRRPIKYYPPEKLHDSGFLLDKQAKRKSTAFAQQTLCWKKERGSLTEDWLSGSEMNHLFRNNVHQTKSDVFIPAGGRPRTLHSGNIEDFLDGSGNPTARVIIEGANLYLTEEARRFLEERNVLVVKDSSANKTGVICSSFEVMCGLVLDDATFLKEKDRLVKETLERVKVCASNEASLMLKTLKEKGGYLTDISEEISSRINEFTYQLLDHLDPLPLSSDPGDPLIRLLLRYALPTLAREYSTQFLHQIPDHHKKAMIACHLSSNLVYHKGLGWRPSIVEVLPVLLSQ